MFYGFGLITGILLWFGALIVVRCDRIAERQVAETLETRDGVTVPVQRVVQEGRVDVTVEQRILGVLLVRTERLADVVRAGVERKPGGPRSGTSGGPRTPKGRLVLRDGQVWDSQPVRWAAGTPPRDMAPRIQEFVDHSSAKSLRFWSLHWVMATFSAPFLLIFLLFLAAGVNLARQQLVSARRDQRRPGAEALTLPERSPILTHGHEIGPSMAHDDGRKERSMRRGVFLTMAVVMAAVTVALAAPPVSAQAKKLVYWTHWEQNPEFNKFYETKGKEFAQKTGWSVEVVTVPYQGYEAKYLAALIGKSGAPDMFMGMTHHWCGQYDFCDKMPADLAKIWDENLPKYMVSVGKWKGARYGIPIEHGNFQQMYINVDLFRKAGLDPDKPPKTLDEWLAAMKKLTVLDGKGEATQVGFALRHKGHPVGITDKFLPFAHAFGARMLSPDLEKATGFANSPEMVSALQFYMDLVLKDKVASIAFPTPEDAFGQKRAATIFRESWFFGWVKKNAPDVTFKVYALPCGKTCPGAGNLFPWTNIVYKNSPNKQAAWDFMKFISNAKDDLDQHQAQGILPVWTANLESAYVKARPDYQSTQDMLKQPVPPEYYHPKSNELATAFGEAVVAALYGKGQPKPLLDEAAAKMDRILKD